MFKDVYDAVVEKGFDIEKVEGPGGVFVPLWVGDRDVINEEMADFLNANVKSSFYEYFLLFYCRKVGL
jgi:hypothetical protein